MPELEMIERARMYTALSKDGVNKRTGGGLSAKTIIEHHRLISHHR